MILHKDWLNLWQVKQAMNHGHLKLATRAPISVHTKENKLQEEQANKKSKKQLKPKQTNNPTKKPKEPPSKQENIKQTPPTPPPKQNPQPTEFSAASN